MDEQRLDFMKIKKMIGRCSPKELGSLMKQYHNKWCKGLKVEPLKVPSLIDVFDGGL